jgi:hypothetical protein
MSAANPVPAFVAFLRIPQFEAHSAAEQAGLKEKLEAGTRHVLANLPASERIVLDAEDGFAVVLFADASRALDVTQALRAQAGAPVSVGLTYGPLALTSRGAEARVFGDGLSAASAAARFATPHKVLVTDNFARALRAQAPGRAVELADAGEFTDARVRMHSFFTAEPERGVSRRRRLAGYTLLGVALILLAGVLGRDIYQPMFQARPAYVELHIRPRGEVLVDGFVRGRVPQLTQIEVEPGRHRLQVRNPGSPPLDLTLDLKAGQRVSVTHTFVRAPEPKGDLLRELKRKFGS